MAPTIKKAFCPNCQTDVEAIMGRGPDGSPLAKCSICGTLIKDLKPRPASETLSLDDESFVDDSISMPNLDTALVVGYTPTVRQALVDKMTERHLARNLVPLQNGEEMVISMVQQLNHKSGNGKVELVVLDVPMPFLNGINAAIGLRAIERTYPEHDLVPILFLTNKPCDDTFRKVIKFLAPSKYATLGPVDDHAKFLAHINRILSLLAQEKW